jgi:hypothetical protein
MSTPLPGNRVSALRLLLKLTDELRAHVLGGRLQDAAAVQEIRQESLRRFFAESVSEAERSIMVEACCAMLDMDQAVLNRLEVNRAQIMEELAECSHRQITVARYTAHGH